MGGKLQSFPQRAGDDSLELNSLQRQPVLARGVRLVDSGERGEEQDDDRKDNVQLGEPNSDAEDLEYDEGLEQLGTEGEPGRGTRRVSETLTERRH